MAKPVNKNATRPIGPVGKHPGLMGKNNRPRNPKPGECIALEFYGFDQRFVNGEYEGWVVQTCHFKPRKGKEEEWTDDTEIALFYNEAVEEFNQQIKCLFDQEKILWDRKEAERVGLDQHDLYGRGGRRRRPFNIDIEPDMDIESAVQRLRQRYENAKSDDGKKEIEKKKKRMRPFKPGEYPKCRLIKRNVVVSEEIVKEQSVNG